MIKDMSNAPTGATPRPTSEALAMFLDEAARYFENRGTRGEDKAHWANVYNAMNARHAAARIRELEAERDRPVDVVLFCPTCGVMHVDAPEPEKGWTNPPHKSHLCHNCGFIWRAADVPTNGIAEPKTRGKHDTPPTEFPDVGKVAEGSRAAALPPTQPTKEKDNG